MLLVLNHIVEYNYRQMQNYQIHGYFVKSSVKFHNLTLEPLTTV